MMSFILYTKLTFYRLSTTREYSSRECNRVAVSGLGFVMGLGQTQPTSVSTIFIYLYTVDFSCSDINAGTTDFKKIHFA